MWRAPGNRGLETRTGSLSRASLFHLLYMEISQSCNAQPCAALVVDGGFSDVLKIWSSDISKEAFERLASDHEN